MLFVFHSVFALTYSRRYERMVLQEHREASRQLKEQLSEWTAERLVRAGVALEGRVEVEGELWGEKMARVQAKLTYGVRLSHVFRTGDVLMLTSQSGRRECAVVDAGDAWVSVSLGQSWPEWLWSVRRHVDGPVCRLDRVAAEAPLKAQLDALRRVDADSAGPVARLLASSAEDVEVEARRPHFRQADIDEAVEATATSENEAQREAAKRALARTIASCRGPPGTGKTVTAALVIASALRLCEDRVLAVAHSNAAADVLLEALVARGVPAVRLGRPSVVSPRNRDRTLSALADSHPEIVSMRRRNATLADMIEARQNVKEAIVKTAPVVVSSCVGASSLLENSTFPLVVLDEASQTTEPALLVALAAARAERLIMVGDPEQLPPTIKSHALRTTLGRSPMTRLRDRGLDQFTLQVQYRMAPSLLEFPSSHFYDGAVECAPGLGTCDPPSGLNWPHIDRQQDGALVFLDVADEEVQHDSSTGYSNPAQVDLVLDLLDALPPNDDIAVIAPYARQVDLLRSSLDARATVGTVDAFQGSESDVVIISTVRSNHYHELGFLHDPRRLNVAITRAKSALVVVGNSNTLKASHHWAAFLASLDERGFLIPADDIFFPADDDDVPLERRARRRRRRRSSLPTTLLSS